MQQNLDPQTGLENLRETLEALTDDLSPLFREDSAQVNSWRRSLEAVSESLLDQTLRIAVVGPVKSGKSTFINALQGRDLLRRGAGIITAFITRVRAGSEEKGWVELKSWEEINSEVNEALAMVDLVRGSKGPALIDLRRQEDRNRMQQLIQELKQETVVGGETFDPNVVLIDAYLSGYATLTEYVKEKPVLLEFGADELQKHQAFVSQESQAVYLRDMELQLPISWLGEMVEIGDCQGSDSPNPLHFALLQEYLLSSHYILYLVSSRVGLRQADLKLIEAIRILRMLPQTLFVINTDFDEHVDLDELQQLQERVGDELNLLVPEAKIYTFSALFHLLEAEEHVDNLSSRERRRLEGWQEEAAMVDLSRRDYDNFRNDLKVLVNNERNRVLYGGVLSHLQRVSRSMKDSVNTRQKLLSRDQGELQVLAEEIRMRQQSVAAALDTVTHTLSGLRESLKGEIGKAVDSYFDTKYGPIIRDTMLLIENYQAQNFERIRSSETKKLLPNLYLFYQDFRQMLSRHIIDKINLRIIDFAKNEEEHIDKRLTEAATGYWDLLRQALEQYHKTLADRGLTISYVAPEKLPRPKRPPIKPPPFSAFIQRSESLGRGSLLVRFSLRRLGNLFSGLKNRVLRRSRGAEESGEEAFREAVALIKNEAQNELLTYFKDYRQNFKYAYLFSYTEHFTEALLRVFQDFGEAAMVDISHLQQVARKKVTSQEDTTEDLAIVKHRLNYMEENLRLLEQGLGVRS
ncbi:MAG: dynamin family protein [Deltaproteobacteria bacterium]|nr:dynamin family protein [Deltaproteobacteria bacterium]